MKALFVVIIAILTGNLVHAQQKVVISGSGDLLQDNDSIRVVVYPYNTSGYDKRLYNSYDIPIKNHCFRISLNNIKQATEITISEPKYKFPTFDHYIIFPGDSINLTWSAGKLNFSGLHYEMFALFNRLQKIRLDAKMPAHMSPQYFAAFIAKFDSIYFLQKQTLEAQKPTVNGSDYRILEDEVESNPLISSMYIFNFLGGGLATDSVVKTCYQNKLKRRFDNFNTLGYISDDGLDFLVSRYKLDSCDYTGKRFIAAEFVKYVQGNFPAGLRERLLIHFLMKSHDLSGNAFIPLRSFAYTIKEKDLRDIVMEFANSIANGRKAYDFKLPDSEGKEVSLSDFKGKVVVLDFWFTGCPGCRVLAPYLKNIEKSLTNAGVKFISISVDKNLSKWKNSINEGVYANSSLLNLNAGQANSGESTINGYKVLAYPSLYIVDKKGHVINVEVDPRVDNGQQFIKQLKSLL